MTVIVNLAERREGTKVLGKKYVRQPTSRFSLPSVLWALFRIMFQKLVMSSMNPELQMFREKKRKYREKYSAPSSTPLKAWWCWIFLRFHDTS